jgi:F0F1-type ATP synthase assembly protein I
MGDEFRDERERAEKLLKKSGQKKKHSTARALALVSQLGLQVVVCIALGVIIGLFLDRRFETMPLFLIIFSVLGSGGSVKIIYDIAKDWDD